MGIAKGCTSNLAWAEGLKLPSPLDEHYTMRETRNGLNREDFDGPQ